MLRELNVMASDTAFVRDSQDTVVHSRADKRFGKSEVHHISFTDSDHKNGKAMVFHADEGECWPLVGLA